MAKSNTLSLLVGGHASHKRDANASLFLCGVERCDIIRAMEKLCSKCKGIRKTNNRYCRACHRKYMRKWRETHFLSEESQKKANCRTYANTYLRRGRLVRQVCEICGNVKVEMHHEDYTQPLKVRWFCKKHH
jgi:RNA polymerase subunit RPABC4/transcription elongation factor Spt4